LLCSFKKIYYIGDDSKDAALQQAEIISELYASNPLALDLNGDGNINYVVLEGEANHQAALLRTEWAIKALQNEGIPIHKLAAASANWDRNQASAIMEGWIKKVLNKIENVKLQYKEYEYTTGEIHKLVGKEYFLKVRTGNINRVSLNKETNEILLVTNSENVENKKKIMDKWYFDCARKLFPEVVNKWLKILGESIEHLSIKLMKTRWGSCNYNKRYINLNTELIKRTPFEIEYVVLHELAHLKYPNHGKGFYNYIENYMPNYKKAEKMLNAKHYY